MCYCIKKFLIFQKEKKGCFCYKSYLELKGTAVAQCVMQTIREPIFTCSHLDYTNTSHKGACV